MLGFSIRRGSLREGHLRMSRILPALFIVRCCIYAVSEHPEALASFKQSTDCYHQSYIASTTVSIQSSLELDTNKWITLACASRLNKQALYPAAVRAIDGS